MPQTQVRDRIAKGIPGLPFGDHCSFVSKTNQNPQAKQIEQITVDTASDDTDYSVDVNGVTVTHTSKASGATKETIRDGLIDAIEAEPLVSGHVLAEPGQSTDVLTLTAVWPGRGFTLSESDANLSASQTQASAEADPLPFGRAVVLDGLDLDEGGQGATLADAAVLTKAKVEITVPFIASAVYDIAVTVNGTTHSVTSTADSDQDTTVANLVADLNDALPANTVIASDDGGGTSSEVILEAELAGLPFEVTAGVSDDGASNPDMTIASDNRGVMTDIRKAMVGVSAVKSMTAYGNGADIDPNDIFDVLEEGKIIVEPEASVSAGDEVWVRLSANGSLDELGVFRGDKDTGCVKLPDARWHGTFEGGDLAVLDVG